jgi:hypothetical protein
MDVNVSLARVEPVRGTSISPNADYLTWSSQARNDRTSPGVWASLHPTALAQDSGHHPYPWC